MNTKTMKASWLKTMAAAFAASAMATGAHGAEVFQVGDDATASVDDGVCTITGTGSISRENDDFQNQWANVKDVRIEEGITEIGAYAFHKFYNLTNVTIAASCEKLGEGAFLRCHSLEQITFEGAMPWDIGDNALVICAGIRMEGDQPIVYATPYVTVNGNGPSFMGSNDLQAWEKIESTDTKNYHFFKFTIGD